MKSLIPSLTLAVFASACGNTNLNEMLVSEAQKNAIDQIVQEAKYEYNKGNFDKALSLTDKSLAINPYGEESLILKSYVFLSKAGLDGFNISKTMIENSEAEKKGTATTTGDKTTDNFNSFKKVMNLQESDYPLMAEEGSVGENTVYFPMSAPEAREGGSLTLQYLNQAISILCPILDPAANPEGDTDERHDCQLSPYATQSKARSDFAWALAHLGEAITFYSVVLYDDDGDGVPNIQAAIPSGSQSGSASEMLSQLVSINNAMESIFPTDEEEAADSMLNALFADLKTTASALAAIPGIPDEVTDSVNQSITDLEAKISQIGGSTSSAGDASVQNEAIKNALTTGMAADMKETIETKADELSAEDQLKACCVYRSINSTAEKPSTCSSSSYNDSTCIPVLASE